jgi:hypothetical protein
LEDQSLARRRTPRQNHRAFVIDGAINSETFRADVEQILVPTLTPGDIVTMDNLGSHKIAGVRQSIEAAGAELLYLPPYSPISIPLSRSSPSSRRSCVPPPRARSTPFGRP